MLPERGIVLVAVSGGADSLTLLGVLDELAPEHGWRLVVATIDHGWTPEAAAACDGVEALAHGLGWPVERRSLAGVQQTEAAARTARHRLLSRLADEHGAVAIALGHTADDRVETMLFNLLRGAGTTGMGAMAPRAGRLVRPLIETSRRATRTYVSERGWTAHEDPTNRSRSFDRNRLRLDVVPLLRAFRPGAGEAMRRAVRVLGMEREMLGRYAESLLDRRWVEPRPEQALGGLAAGLLDVVGWGELPDAERWLVLRAFCERVAGDLQDHDLAAAERLDALALGPADVGVQRQGELRIGRCGSMVAAVGCESEAWGPVPLPAAGEVLVDAAALSIGVGQRWPLAAALRAEGELFVRSVRPGDRLRPEGRGGSRKAADLLAELSVPRQVRLRVPIVVCEDQPVWVPGVAPAEGWAGPRLVGVRYGPCGLWYDGAALRSSGR